MKPVILLAILVTLQACLAMDAFASKPTYNCPADNRHNEPYSLNRIDYPLSEQEFNWADSTWALRRIKSYTTSEINPQLSIITSGTIYGIMTILYRTDHYYSDSGELQYICFLESPDWSLFRLDRYIYNVQNQLVQIQYYNDPVSTEEPGQMNGRMDYYYDGQGNKTAALNYNMYPGFEYIHDQTLYYYNAQNQLIRDVYSWCNDDFYLEYSHTTLYTYNPDGSLNEMYGFQTGSSINSPGCSKTIYVYDPNGYNTRKDIFQIPIPDGMEFETSGVVLFDNDAWGRHVEEIRQDYYNETWHNIYRYLTEYRPSGNDDQLSPSVYSLRCHPNPFTSELQISFETKESGHYKMEIYNIRGQRVRTLGTGDIGKGLHNMVWDSKGDRGERCASGIYLLKLTSKHGTETKKVMLLN